MILPFCFKKIVCVSIQDKNDSSTNQIIIKYDTYQLKQVLHIERKERLSYRKDRALLLAQCESSN